jgi:hypothetical protein
MTTEIVLGILALVGTTIGAAWKLSTEMSIIKITLEKLLTKFEQVEKIEKRVDRLEKKVFNLESSSDS